MKRGKRNTIRIVYKLIFWAFMLLFFGLILGTISHEILGHGITSLFFGNKIIAVEILTLKINSHGLNFVPFSGFGAIWYENTTNPTLLSGIIIKLMGSSFPLIVSLLASLYLLLKKPKGFKKILLICFSLFFIDSLMNYVIWPFLGGGSDFDAMIKHTPYNITPFILISILSALIIGSVIIYSISDRNNKKWNKFLQYSLLIIFILLIASFTYIILQSNTFEKHGMSGCKKIMDIERRDGCNYMFAEITYNPSLCEGIRANSTKTDCFWDVAYFSGDFNICKKIDEDSKKNDCFSDLAEKVKNPLICNEITNETLIPECLYEINN